MRFTARPERRGCLNYAATWVASAAGAVCLLVAIFAVLVAFGGLFGLREDVLASRVLEALADNPEPFAQAISHAHAALSHLASTVHDFGTFWWRWHCLVLFFASLSAASMPPSTSFIAVRGEGKLPPVQIRRAMITAAGGVAMGLLLERGASSLGSTGPASIPKIQALLELGSRDLYRELVASYSGVKGALKAAVLASLAVLVQSVVLFRFLWFASKSGVGRRRKT